MRPRLQRQIDKKTGRRCRPVYFLESMVVTCRLQAAPASSQFGFTPPRLDADAVDHSGSLKLLFAIEFKMPLMMLLSEPAVGVVRLTKSNTLPSL